MALKSWFRIALEDGGMTSQELMQILCLKSKTTATNRINYPGSLRLDEIQAIYQRLGEEGKSRIRNELGILFR